MIASLPLELVGPRSKRDATATAAQTAPSLAPYLFTQISAAALIIIAIAVLLGWFFDIEPLMTVIPGKIRMKANAAVAFIAIGIALFCAVRRSISSSERGHQWASTGMALGAAIALGLGAATLIEYLFHINLPLGEHFFADPKQWPYPGRMAPISTANFTLAGLSLLLLGGGRTARALSQLVALAILTVAFTGIVGFIYGVPLFYGSIGYTSMALHTGVSFLLLSCGIVAAQPESHLVRLICGNQPGSWLMRRLLPLIAAGPVALGWIYLQPSFSFGRPSFALALFAVTLVISGLTALAFAASALNRIDTERRDIAQMRERSAAAVRQSEQELLLVTDHLPVLLSYLDAEGRYVRVNRTYEDWLGLPADRIVGRTVEELLGGEYWARVRPIRDCALEGHTATVETLYPTVRGERRAQITYAPDLDPYGAVRGMACMVVDVEDHRRAEAGLRQSEKLAVVGRLASSIAHEINNPLEAVTNLLYLLQQDTAGQEQANAYVVQAQDELARVSQIVVQTLRFHRQATHPIVCRASELVEQVIGLYRGRLAGPNIKVEVRFRDHAPFCCRDGEIRQVIANLVGNAIDAMAGAMLDAVPEAGRHHTGRLLLRTRSFTNHKSGQSGVLFTVADTGHGIPAASLQRLFEPFYSTKGATGSGLGLWVSKEIVDRHGGSLHIRTSCRPTAHGTIFAIFFPSSSESGRTDLINNRPVHAALLHSALHRQDYSPASQQ